MKPNEMPRRWKYTVTYRLPTVFGGGRLAETISGVRAMRVRVAQLKASGAKHIKVGPRHLG